MSEKRCTATRHTFQKDLVFNTVCALHHHPTAQEIFEELHKNYPSVSRATVYRILSSLSEQHLILRVELPNGADCFDFNTSEHGHFLCRKCKRIADVTEPLPAIKLPESVDGGSIDGYSLLYHGVCRSCSEPRK